MDINQTTTVTFNRQERAVIEEAALPIRIVYPDYDTRDKREAPERGLRLAYQKGEELTRERVEHAHEALSNLLAKCREEADPEYWGEFTVHQGEPKSEDGVPWVKPGHNMVEVLVETRAYQARACEDALAVLTRARDYLPLREAEAITVDGFAELAERP